MNTSDIDKGIGIATEILNRNSEIKVEIQDEPMFIKRIVGKFKTNEEKDCKIVIYVGILADVKDLRLLSRGVKNFALLRKIPYDDFEESIKGPGTK